MPHTIPKALVIGATGAVGSELVNQLVDSGYEVKVLVRKLGSFADCVQQLVCTNFEQMPSFLKNNVGDLSNTHLFSALETTLKAAGSKANFYQIDLSYNLTFAQTCHELGARHYFLVSAHGADAGSRTFYSSVKGKLEDELSQLGFERCVFFRPSLLLTEHSNRPLEQIAVGFMSPLNRLFDDKPMPKIWPIKPQKVAQAMVGLSLSTDEAIGVRTISNQMMHQGVNP